MQVSHSHIVLSSFQYACHNPSQGRSDFFFGNRIVRSLGAALVYTGLSLTVLGCSTQKELYQTNLSLDQSIQNDSQLKHDRPISRSEINIEAYRKRFVPSAEGDTVTDTLTGLIWQRCVLGQKWENDQCTGKPLELDQKDARRFIAQRANKTGLAVDKLWRVPTIRELASLSICTSGRSKNTLDIGDGANPLPNTCHGSYQSPTIDSTLFPSNALLWMWSSTPSKADASQNYYIYFGNGEVGTKPSNFQFSVRAVRDKSN